jgi:hypothetical protein
MSLGSPSIHGPLFARAQKICKYAKNGEKHAWLEPDFDAQTGMLAVARSVGRTLFAKGAHGLTIP